MSPVGHACFALVFAKNPDRSQNRRSLTIATALFFVFFAWLPDFDFVTGILEGTPGRYHRGVTHTPAFALGMAALVALIMAGARQARPLAWARGALLALLSHVALDYLCSDSTSGLLLLWPLSLTRFYPAQPLISGLDLGGAHVWLANARVVGLEIAFMAMVFAAREIGRLAFEAARNRRVRRAAAPGGVGFVVRGSRMVWAVLIAAVASSALSSLFIEPARASKSADDELGRPTLAAASNAGAKDSAGRGHASVPAAISDREADSHE